MSESYTIDELLVCYMARKINNNVLVVQGMGTPLVFSAFLLAKYTNSPDVQFMYTVGNTISQNTDKLTLSKIEANTMENAQKFVSMTQMHLEIVPSLYPMEFMRPAQIDKFGNTNNVVIGNYYHPKVRLPGSAGIGDVSSFNHNLFFYITDHSKRTLVEKLDFCSSVGYGEKEKELKKMGVGSRGPQEIITNKCVFDLSKHEAELILLHPGVTLEEIKAITGFDFTISDSLTTTKPPTVEELRLIREKVDPLNIRKLEFLRGKRRIDHLKKIVENETAVI